MPHRFPLAIRLLHWTMALLIIAMLFIGAAMVSTASPAYASLIALHRPLGIAILLLAALRLVLRFATGAPPLPADLPRVQQRAARGAHILLYLAMIGLPLIGWAMLSAGGYPVRLTAGFVLPPIVPRDALAYGLLRQAHGLIAFAFFALIHGFVRRDGVLETMGFARAAALDPELAEPEEADEPEVEPAETPGP